MLSFFWCVPPPPHSRNLSPAPSFFPAPKSQQRSSGSRFGWRVRGEFCSPAGWASVGGRAGGNPPGPGEGCSRVLQSCWVLDGRTGGRRWGGLRAGVGVGPVSRSSPRLAELSPAASIYALFIETNVKTFYKYGGGGRRIFPAPPVRCGCWVCTESPFSAASLPARGHLCKGALHGPAGGCVGALPPPHRGARASSSPGPAVGAAGVAGAPESCPAGHPPWAGSVSQPGPCSLPSLAGEGEGLRVPARPPCLPLASPVPLGRKRAKRELIVSNPKLSENSP